MFPMAGHSVQRIWTGFGMQPPYNLRMVMRGLFLQRNCVTPKHHGKFLNASHKGKGSSSDQPRPCRVQPLLLWVGVHVGVDPSIPRCRHSGDNSCGDSNDKSVGCVSCHGKGTGRLEAGGQPTQHH